MMKTGREFTGKLLGFDDYVSMSLSLSLSLFLFLNSTHADLDLGSLLSSSTQPNFISTSHAHTQSLAFFFSGS